MPRPIRAGQFTGSPRRSRARPTISGPTILTQMSRIDWIDYQRVHADRRNLLAHLLAVPLFAISFIAACVSFLRANSVAGAVALGLCVVAMLIQGRGHAVEENPPRPFSGPGNFLRRWFTEQYFIFPMFLLSGRWWRQYRAAEK